MQMPVTFTELIGKPFATALLAQYITEPTDIQSNTIPPALAGKDVVAVAETGTGKTLAYLLPIFARLDIAARNVQAFVVTPTRELSAQVYAQAALLAKGLAAAGGGEVGPDQRVARKPPRIMPIANRITVAHGERREVDFSISDMGAPVRRANHR